MPAPLRDPVGLIARCPELVPLAERSPALRSAIEDGRPLDAYRALYWAHKRGRLGNAPEVHALLSQRRIFVKALTSTPMMFTFNTIGTRLYGESDVDRTDGTYIATLFFVALFIPLFPIGSYLVRPSAEKPGKAWQFLAKVPLASAMYVWQRLGSLAVVGLLCVALANAFWGFRHNTLYVANGLGHPIVVDLAGAPRVTVNPGGEEKILTMVGKHPLVVRDGDRVLEDTVVEIPRSSQTVVWNVLGAAPVVVEAVIYANNEADAKGPQDPEVACGREYLTLDDIDYPFTTPPKSVSGSQSETAIRKRHLLVAPGGSPACVEYLQSHGDAPGGARLAIRVARALKLCAGQIDDETGAALLDLPAAEGEAFAKELLASDDGVDAHRLYQGVLLRSDQRARAITEYDARLAAHPGSADAEYLALRVKDFDAERAAIDRLVATYPTHAFLRRAQIFVYTAAREFPEVVKASDALRALDPVQWSSVLEQHVEALIAVGQTRTAAELLADVRAASSPAHGLQQRAEILAYRLATRVADPPQDAPAIGDPTRDGIAPLLVRAIAGLPLAPADLDALKNPDVKLAMVIALDARNDPAGALERVKTASTRALDVLPRSIEALLLAEATRRSEPTSAGKLRTTFGPQLADAMSAEVTRGTVNEELRDLPLELQAAVDFVRSRAVTGDERARYLARAKEADVLRGPVTLAMEGWPP